MGAARSNGMTKLSPMRHGPVTELCWTTRSRMCFPGEYEDHYAGLAGLCHRLRCRGGDYDEPPGDAGHPFAGSNSRPCNGVNTDRGCESTGYATGGAISGGRPSRCVCANQRRPTKRSASQSTRQSGAIRSGWRFRQRAAAGPDGAGDVGLRGSGSRSGRILVCRH